jgi:hypothetical protein
MSTRTARFTFAACLPALAAVAGADDAADARAIIEKSLKAAGGPAVEAAVVITRGKGSVFIGDQELPHTFTMTMTATRMRVELELQLNDATIPWVRVFNGQAGWTKIGGNLMEMDKTLAGEIREQIFLARVLQLRPLLTEPGLTLSVIGDDKVGERAAVGVRIAREKARDIRLYFDKQTWMVLKAETTVIPEGGTAEVDQATLLSEYKDFDGVKHPTKLVTTRDGKKYLDREATEYRRLDKDKVEESWFARPE